MSQRLKIPPSPDALIRVADSYGTPTVAYFEETIRDRCGQFRSAVSSVPSRLLYAIKANSNPALLRLIGRQVDGFDAVSPGEVELLLRLGVDPHSILYSPNYMSDGEMALAVDQGVVINVGELSRLERFGRAYHGSSVCLRLNLWVGAGHHQYVVTGGKDSKFGIPGDQLDRAVEISGRYGLRIIGLHQHIGSGFSNAAEFAESVRLLVEAARLFPEVEFLNVGGGIGIPYEAGAPPFDLDAISSELRLLQPDLRPGVEFWFEPGRFLVAESGALLVTVTATKRSADRVFAGTDSGFNHLIRPVLYRAHHAIFNLSNPNGPLRRYDIAGNICESGDLFARDREVQEIREGDVLAILDVGAYGVSMASEYNMRPLPEEVLIRVDGGTASIRKRLTASRLVERFMQETEGDDRLGRDVS